jgi:ferredoxin
MRVAVAFELCEGNALCCEAEPEVFGFDDDDIQVRVLKAEVGPWEGTVREAVERCPRQALQIVE